MNIQGWKAESFYFIFVITGAAQFLFMKAGVIAEGGPAVL